MGNMMIFGDNMTAVDKLKDADAGKLFKALLHHVNGEEPDALPYVVQCVYDLLSAQVDRSAQKYAEISGKRSDAGRRGAEVRWQKMANDGKGMANDGKAWLPNPIPKNMNNNSARTRVKKNSFFDFEQRMDQDLDAIVRKEV